MKIKWSDLILGSMEIEISARWRKVQTGWSQAGKSSTRSKRLNSEVLGSVARFLSEMMSGLAYSPIGPIVTVTGDAACDFKVLGGDLNGLDLFVGLPRKDSDELGSAIQVDLAYYIQKTDRYDPHWEFTVFWQDGAFWQEGEE